MRTSNLAVGVLDPALLHLFSMTSQVDTTPSSPTMSSPSRSEKLLRDALLRDERERRHRSSPPPPTTPSSYRRRHSGYSLSPTSSCSASTKEDYACSSSLHGDVTIPQLSQQALLRSPSYGHHLVQQSPPSTPPSPSTKHFNARKASTQCRAIEGYVSFASVEGLGEPPLVGDEFDGDGRGNGNSENESMKGVAFLPLGVLSAALRWKRFVGGDGRGVEGKDQGVVV